MFTCSKCGRKFGSSEIGHIDDHIEICKRCMPIFGLIDKGKDVIKALTSNIIPLKERWLNGDDT